MIQQQALWKTRQVALCRAGSRKAGALLGLWAVGRQVVKLQGFPTLTLSPYMPSKFSIVTMGHLVPHLFSQTIGVLEKATLGQGSH